MNTSIEPRAFTENEVLEMFLFSCRNKPQYWGLIPAPIRERCSGTMFSLLALLDGTNITSCAFDLELNPSEDMTKHLPWCVSGDVIETGELHRLFYKKREASDYCDDVTDRFLFECEKIVNKWTDVVGSSGAQKCINVAKDFVHFLENGNADFPPVKLILKPHPDDEEWCKKAGENWYASDMRIDLTAAKASERFNKQLQADKSHAGYKGITVQTKPTLSETAQMTELLAVDGSISDGFGFSTAMSGDGNTCAVGAFMENVAEGAVHIFIRSAQSWVHQTKIVLENTQAGDRFGYSVALSDDGNTCAIGACTNLPDYPELGGAYIFTRSGTTWTQQAKLTTGNNTIRDNFAVAIALSGDGNTCAVGASEDTVLYPDQGSVYIFTRADGAWVRQAKLTAGFAGPYNRFGQSISLSGDGLTCAVGAGGADFGGVDRGVAHIFARFDTAWVEQFMIRASDGAENDWFGHSIALSSDGNTCAVGADGVDNGANKRRGAVYIFKRHGSAWLQQHKLVANDVMLKSFFGASVALSADGKTCAACTCDNNHGQGSLYVFTLPENTSCQLNAKFTVDGKKCNRHFGDSVAMSNDGSVCVTGAYSYHTSDNDQPGSAYIFEQLN